MKLFQVSIWSPGWCGIPASVTDYWIVADVFDDALKLARDTFAKCEVRGCADRGRVYMKTEAHP